MKPHKVHLPRKLWLPLQPPDEWINKFEHYLNASESVAEAWQRVADSNFDLHELITWLYQDSDVQPDRKPVRELKRSLEKSACLIASLHERLPQLGRPEFSDLSQRLTELAATLRGADSHQDNDCIAFYDSIVAILVDPKIRRPGSGSYQGLPTYEDCIQVIQAAINATDDGVREIRETTLTADGLKAFLKRSRDYLDTYRASFRVYP